MMASAVAGPGHATEPTQRSSHAATYRGPASEVLEQGKLHSFGMKPTVPPCVLALDSEVDVNRGDGRVDGLVGG